MTTAWEMIKARVARWNSDGTALVGPNGQTIPDGRLRGLRPRMLVMGNSLCAINSTAMAGSTTTLSAQALAGATTVVVTSIAGLSSGDKVAVGLYDGTIHYTTINGAPSGSNVVLTNALTRMARSGAFLLKYTTAAPSNIRRNGGPVYMGLAKLGMPVDLIQGYGYGSGTLPEIMADLPRVLEATRPQYVLFIDVENSLVANMTLAQLKAWAHFKIATCLSFGAIPLVNIAYPSSSYAGGDIDVYDAYNAWVVDEMETTYPGAVAIDVGEQWRDVAQTTLRTPLSGWTDGIHPNGNKYATIGDYYAATLESVLPTAASLVDYCLSSNATLQGSGGTNSGMQVGSVIPASFTYTADAGVTATSSVGSAGGSRVEMTVPGTSNVSTTTLKVQTRYTFAASVGSSDQALLGFIKLRIDLFDGITMAFPQLVFSGGETYACGQDSDAATDDTLIGNEYQFETPIVKVPLGATYCDVVFWVRPTSGLANGVNVDFEILEMGVIPSAFVAH